MTDLQQLLSAEMTALLRRHNLLQGLVQRQVIADAVSHVELSDKDKQEARTRFARQNGLTDDAAVVNFLNTHALTPGDLQWQVELPLRIQAHCRENFLHKAEARFLSRKNHLDRVVYSLLRVKDGLLARELYLRIAAEEANFADLAATYAEGPEKATKGIIGPVPLTQAHPALAERLRTTPPGLLMEPFMIEQWWLVVRLERYTPASFNEAMAMQMASELFEERVKEETARTLRQFSSQAVPSLPA